MERAIFLIFNRSNKVNWEDRDSIISKKVESIVRDILSKQDKLIRITRNEIGRRLGNNTLLYKYLDKMPDTKKVLDKYLETLEQFQVRRILHTIKELERNKSVVKEWEVVRKSGLKKEFAEKYRYLIDRELR
ncbi:TnsD family Tn7-like transposition protein [Oceanobacillus profundus]|uniref:TnsD family Tn7-like transposition protein n=1 Tax=Oceanobacillus profundus TaxID=372463 RepID=UPI003624B259